MERWDIYDKNKVRTGRTMERNHFNLADDEYHLTVLGVIRRPDGRFLITKRVMTKAWAPGWWEVSGGAAQAGEESEEAVRREVLEETGLDVKEAEGGYVFTYHRENPGEGDNYFVDVYRYTMDVTEQDVHLQTEETDGCRFATPEEIRELADQGIFLHYDTYSKVYEYCAGCNAHTNAIIGDVNKFPLKNRVIKPLRVISDEQKQPFGDASELVTILNDNDSLMPLVDKLACKGVTTFVLPDTREDYEDIIRISSKRNALIITQDDLFNLQKAGGYYYTSGLVAVIYDRGKATIGKQYLSVRNNLCGKTETRVIHIIKENTYLEELGKTFIELVDGPSLSSDTLYV